MPEKLKLGSHVGDQCAVQCAHSQRLHPKYIRRLGYEEPTCGQCLSEVCRDVPGHPEFA